VRGHAHLLEVVLALHAGASGDKRDKDKEDKTKGMSKTLFDHLGRPFLRFRVLGRGVPEKSGGDWLCPSRGSWPGDIGSGAFTGSFAEHDELRRDMIRQPDLLITFVEVLPLVWASAGKTRRTVGVLALRRPTSTAVASSTDRWTYCRPIGKS
jgi:hypothetical protein